MLIYQVENGADNTAKVPLGGVIYQDSPASSMDSTILNPITFYGGRTVINQDGHSGDLYNYYWTSYSRGTDGRGIPNDPKWHNAYLDGYIPLRVKSIYDPCPYLYRIPSNGTYNQITLNQEWTNFSYLGGTNWNMTIIGEGWFSALGRRLPSLAYFESTGRVVTCWSSTLNAQIRGYVMVLADKTIYINYTWEQSTGHSVRCIEDADSPLKYPILLIFLIDHKTFFVSGLFFILRISYLFMILTQLF